MGLFENALLTVVIIVIDLMLLNEYLRLEDELKRIREITPQADFQEMAREVNEPLPEHSFEPVELPLAPRFTLEAEPEVKEVQEATKAKNGAYSKKLDELALKLNDVAARVSKTREKMEKF